MMKVYASGSDTRAVCIHEFNVLLFNYLLYSFVTPNGVPIQFVKYAQVAQTKF